MANKFVTVMEQIGKDCLKVLDEVIKYLPGAAALAAIIFPAQTAVISGVVNSVELIQNAVATIEAKYQAGGVTGNGPQKLADVLTMVGPTVTQLLTAEGLHVDTTTITNITNAVVAILKVQVTTNPAVPATPVAVAEPAAEAAVATS